jgi:diaminopimelate epimerase
MLRLSKHEASGNDFLVLLDPTGTARVGASFARAVCDRRRGVGADGLLAARPGRDGADLAMELWNADGGTAEMSGNGLRCLAQAVVEAGLVVGPDVTVLTLAGLRRATVRPGASPAVAWVEADMGAVEVDDAPVALAGSGTRPWRGRRVRVGNPHLVLLGEDLAQLATLDLVREGGDLADELNVEWVVAGPEQDVLTLRVLERGAGETLACGTGSVAAAAVARALGIVGDEVVVRNPGGDLRVALDGASARLAGPVRRVAWVELEPEELSAP